MSARGWRTQDEVKDLFEQEVIIHSVGYILRRTRKKLALVGSIDHREDEIGPNVNQYQEIPMSAVVSIRRIK